MGRTSVLKQMTGAVLAVAMVTGCAATNTGVSEYDNTYVGVLDDACSGKSRLEAHVSNGKFRLLLPNRRDVQGEVRPDGKVTATGTWSDDQGPVNAVLEGQISGKLLGHTLTATMHDDRCNPDLTLAPEQSKRA
jgi:hypothetical protein